jgi:hypothetical protein
VRITRPNDLAGPKGMKPKARPDWFVKWLKEQGHFVLLECGCIEDAHLPQCLELITGKRILILCPFNEGHGFQKVKKTLNLREVLKVRGYEFPEPPGLIPPY